MALRHLYANTIFLACVVGALMWSWAPVQAQQEATPLQIEADVFSGRPNPRWDLTGSQAAEFLAQLRALRTTEVTRLSQAGLGYRGFVVRVADEAIDGFSEIKIYRGVILTKAGALTKTLSDPDRALERQLVSFAKGHLDDTVLRYIEDEIGR